MHSEYKTWQMEVYYLQTIMCVYAYTCVHVRVCTEDVYF